MGELLTALGSNWATIATIIFSGVVAWTAVINTRLSKHLATAELHPAISVYLELDQRRRWFFELVVRNSGRGIARNVKFKVDPDIPFEHNDPKSYLTRISFIRNGLGYLGSGQELRVSLNSYPVMVKEPICVTVSYEPENPAGMGKRIESQFVLDVREFEGMATIGQEAVSEVADHLKQIAGDIRSIKQGGSFANLTVTVKRRYFFSTWANRQSRRWFGPAVLGRDQSVFSHFRNEIKKLAAQRIRAIRSK